MPNYNQVTIIGHLTRGIELKTSAGGTTYCNSGIAYNDRKKKAHFFDFTAFGKTAELLASSFEKGDAVGLVGELAIDQWDAKDGTKRSKPVILVNHIIFVGGGQRSSAHAGHTDYATSLPDDGQDEPAF